MRTLLLAAVMLAGCSAAPAPTPERVIERRSFDGDAPRGEGLLRRAMLEAHNAARAATLAPPLKWNKDLAEDAEAYASSLAKSGRFEHSQGPRGKVPEGENLWMGSRGAYTYEEMAGHWIAESRYYRPLPTPRFSTTGRWQDVAHYTQIIWRGTAEIGCGEAHDGRNDYVVCRYSPPGNVWGRLP